MSALHVDNLLLEVLDFVGKLLVLGLHLLKFVRLIFRQFFHLLAMLNFGLILILLSLVTLKKRRKPILLLISELLPETFIDSLEFNNLISALFQGVLSLLDLLEERSNPLLQIVSGLDILLIYRQLKLGRS